MKKTLVKILCTVMVLLTFVSSTACAYAATETPCETYSTVLLSAKANKKKPRKISRKALRKKYAAAIKANKFSAKSYYTLVDIDRDGIPELFQRHRHDEGGTFYYLNSKNKISHYNTGGSMVYHNKYYVTLYPGSTMGTLFKLKNGKLKEIATSDCGYYYYKSKEISAKEYNKRIKACGVDLNVCNSLEWPGCPSLKSAFKHYKW